jgi:predicted component of type VI protein secretion system
MEQTYRRDSQATVRTAYQEANAFEAPVFDLAPAIDVLRTIDAGLPRPARALPPQPVPEDPINRYLGITEPPQPLPPRAQPDIDLRPPEPEISQVLKELEGLDPAGVDLEALLAIREKLYDLKTPKPGETAVRIHAQAGQAYDAITNVIKNPTNSSEDFVLSWQRANGLAEQRFRTLDRALITNIVRSEQGFTTTTLSQLANTLIKPNQSENIEFLKELGLNGEVAIKYLQNTFETKILDNMLNPVEAANLITRMDKPTLNALMPVARQEQLKSLLNNVEELQGSNVRASLDAQSMAQPLLSDILNNPSSRSFDYLNKLIDDSGGLDSELGRAIRHGLKDNIIEKAIEAGGDQSVKTEALAKELKRIAEMGLMRFLTPDDRKMLRDFSKISDFFTVTRGTADAGTSIRAAEITADLYRFGDPDKVQGAIMEIVKAYGVSRFMLSDFGRGMLLGRAGVKYSELDPLRLATMVTGSIASDARNRED